MSDLVEGNSSLEVMLGRYPEPVTAQYLVTREWLFFQCPALQEVPDPTANIVGYGLGEGYKGMVCTLIFSKTGLKLGLAFSAGFPDPNGLLKGTGKVHRHVVLPSTGAASVVGLEDLLQTAIVACKDRLGIS